MSELKRCPFCGSASPKAISHKVGCLFDLLDKGIGEFEKLEASWQSRPLEDALQAKLERASADYELLDYNYQHQRSMHREEVDALQAKLEKVKETLMHMGHTCHFYPQIECAQCKADRTLKELEM